jgi:metal-sulfur cluster biosynthetic enzyme
MTKDQVLAALENIVDPCSKAMGRPMSIVELGLVDREGVRIDQGRVEVGLDLCILPRSLLMGEGGAS